MKRQTGEQRQQQILETAVTLFAAHGYEGTTTRAIAESAGVTEALIFHYFPSKLALFHAVIRDYGFQRFNPPALDMLEGQPMSEVLSFLLNRFLDTFWNNRMALRMLIGETWHDRVALDDLQMLHTRPQERLQILLAGYEAAGEIKPGLAAPAASVISAAAGGFLIRCLRAEPENWETTRSEFVRDLLNLILPGLTP